MSPLAQPVVPSGSTVRICRSLGITVAPIVRDVCSWAISSAISLLPGAPRALDTPNFLGSASNCELTVISSILVPEKNSSPVGPVDLSSP